MSNTVDLKLVQFSTGQPKCIHFPVIITNQQLDMHVDVQPREREKLYIKTPRLLAFWYLVGEKSSEK